MFETKIISGSQDKAVCIWDVLGGLLEDTLEGHTDGVYSVAYTPDGTKIISGSKDNTFGIWDAHSSLLEGVIATLLLLAVHLNSQLLIFSRLLSRFFHYESLLL